MALPTGTGQSEQDMIEEHLNRLEREHEIKILLACEVGSRAWGLNSPTSDYDVKFIYVRRLNWYFGVEEEKRDVIDDSSAFDMNGWDIRKALQLLRESNCGILEWLNSSHMYRVEKSFLDGALEISKITHCRRSLVLAYWGKASKHYKEYILTELKDGTVYLKKYLFVIQAILSCRFSLLNPTLPPHDFATLLESFASTTYQIPSDVHQLATELMTKKRAGTLTNGLRYKQLDKWIESSLVELEKACKAVEKKSRDVIKPFNDLFAEMAIGASGYEQNAEKSYFSKLGLPP